MQDLISFRELLFRLLLFSWDNERLDVTYTLRAINSLLITRLHRKGRTAAQKGHSRLMPQDVINSVAPVGR